MLWQDASEIVAGLCLKQRLNPEVVNPMHLFPPYDLVVSMLLKGQDTTDIIEKIGLAPVQACVAASEMVDARLPADWISILESAASKADASSTFKRAADKLATGEDPDYGRISEALDKLQHTDGTAFITLDRVDASEAVWRKTYYQPLDEHLGNGATCGIPDAGLTIIGAPPGTGKSSLLVKMFGCAVKAGKKVCLVSLEMTNGQIVNRFIETSGLTMEERSRIISAEDSMTLDEVYSKVSRLTALEDIYLIGIDFADLLLDEAEEESSVAHVYRTLAKLAKRTGVPVILLSQLNREYVGGIPRIHHIRYSGLAEAMGALILLLYNPGQTWSKLGTDERLPLSKGKGYIIVGKSRFGYSGPSGNQYEQTGTGAIQVEWDGLTSWGTTSYGWYSLT